MKIYRDDSPPSVIVDVNFLKVNMKYPDMNIMILRLYEKWGAFTLMAIGTKLWLCMDCTDEGLGPCRFNFEGNTPINVVQKAYRTISRLYPNAKKRR